jgi:hypothetical protein
MFGDFLKAEGLKEVLQAFNADGIASPNWLSRLEDMV